MRVLVTRRIDPALLSPLHDVADVEVFEQADDPISQAELLVRCRGVDGLLTMLTDRIDEAVFAAAGPQLRCVANAAVGYDNVDVAAAAARGVQVTHTPGVLTETTADLVFALMLAAARRVVEADRWLRRGQWHAWAPMLMTGQDVYGQTLGIVGLGRIGEAVARRAAGFGMRVVYHNRHRRPDAEASLGVRYLPFHDLLAQSDFVVVLVPATGQTQALFSTDAFSRMKPTAVFVNAARGSVVDETALVHALQRGQIFAAGLDVYQQEPLPSDHPLLALENVVLLPHIGSASVATRRRMVATAVADLKRALTGERPRHLVPELQQQ
ncbi:MAG: D-glycerate dehydrogenase [Alicyclobacillus sp.]|nr:D-glycerate dehydrogenase [Alicyclobacillus sp.]